MKEVLLIVAACLVLGITGVQNCFQRADALDPWWTFGVDGQCQTKADCVLTGTKVEYYYESPVHNVFTMLGDDAFDDCLFGNEVCNATEGGTCTETFNVPGVYYRACAIGQHCVKGGMKLKFTVQDVCPPPPPIYPPSDPYRTYGGSNNNLASPNLGSNGSPYRTSVNEHHGRDFYAFWGTGSSFEPYLRYCSEKSKAAGLSYLDGGGADIFIPGPPLFTPPNPFIDNFWALGDPVLFCQNYLVQFIGAPDAPAGLTQAVLDDAPVLPTAREVSNILFSQRQQRTSTYTNDLGTYFSMFVTIDTASQSANRNIHTAIPYKFQDKWKDPGGLCCTNPYEAPDCFLRVGSTNIGCFGSVGRLNSNVVGDVSDANPRVPLNRNNHFLDLSHIYGFDFNHLDYKADDPAFLNDTHTYQSPFLRALGNPADRNDFTGTTWDFRPDWRVNKVPQMKVLGDLFLLNHNRLAREIEKEYPTESADRDWLFEEARRINIAQYQDIVFREYVPSVLGRPLEPYDTNKDGLAAQRNFGNSRQQYNPNLDPSLDITFSVSAYRFGHTKVPTHLPRRDRFFDDSVRGDSIMRDCWLNISTATEYDTAPEDIIRGMVSSRQLKTMAAAADEVRNLMFDAIDRGSDLMAINIMRGREAGIPSVNAVREALGLEPYTACEQLTTNEHDLQVIYQLYGNDPECINRIDFYVAGLVEDPFTSQAAVGETFYNVLFDQFTRLRNGDRFYYENQLSRERALEVGTPAAYHPNPLSDTELSEVYETNLEQLFALNYDDIEIGDLGAGLFFLRNRQLETLQFGGQAIKTNSSLQDAEFELGRQLSPSYQLQWRIDGDELTVRMTVATLGWVGFGLEPDANTMKNADIYFCTVRDGVGEITDRFALDVGPPTLDNTLIGGGDDIISFSAAEIDGSTVCTFTRKLEAGDQYDKTIEDRVMKVMFAFNPETDELVYHGPTRQSDVFINFFDTLPVDEVPDGLLIAMAVLAALGIIFAMIIVLVIQAKDSFFRLMSPLFCQLICIGSMFCFGAVLTLVKNNPPSEASCTAYPWLLGFGFMVMYGCLFAKTLRLYRVIKTSLKMQTKVITNNDVLAMVALFSVPMLIFLILWTAIDGFEVEHAYTSDDRDEVRDQCDTPVVWWAIYVAIIGVVLAIGCVLTFMIRNLPEEFNDSEAIGFSIYNALLMLIIGAGIGWGLDENRAATVAIQGFTILVFAWFTLVVLFVPTLYRLGTGGEPRQFKSQVGTLNTGAGGSTNVGGGSTTNE